MSNYLAHAIGIQATHYLPLNSDVRSPRASYNKSDDKIHVHWTIDQTPVDTTMDGYSRNKFGDVVYNSMSVSFCKDMIKRYGTGYLNSYKDSRAVWDDGRLTQMARNMHNQLQSALAQVSNQTNGVSHSAMDIIDISDTLEHSTFGNDYVSNNPYVNGPNSTVKNLTFRQRDSGFSKTSRGTYVAYLAYFYSSGYGAHFPVEYYKGFTEASIQHYIKVTLNNILPDAVVTPNEIRKGASFAADGFRKFENSHGSKAIRHSLFTEVYDMDDYIEHHGVLGMKWGVRRYQNEDGSLTEAGRKRYINKKYKQSRTTFEKELNEKLEGKSKEEQTKIIRQESRDLAEAAANRANTNTKRMIGTTAIGGTAGGVAGGLLAGPIGAIFGAYGASVITAIGSSLAIALGEQFLYSERNRAKDNLLNMKYDEINIDEETKRRLNL